MTLVERVQSVADLAGSEANEERFVQEFTELWAEMRAAVRLMEKLAKAQTMWKQGKIGEVAGATWN